jgi:diguanylate cyclase (GGDEF)-like protein
MGTIGMLGAHLYGGYIAPIYIDQERDMVSGLLNEIVFYRQLREHVAACYDGRRCPFTMLAIGIDRFRDLRAAAGHLEMDTLIGQVGSQIDAALDGRGVAARIVDGQFNILLNERIGPQHSDLAQKLIDQMHRQPPQGEDLRATLSIAIVEYNENIHGKMDRKLVSHAFRAMYRMQSEGGDRLIFAPEP